MIEIKTVMSEPKPAIPAVPAQPAIPLRQEIVVDGYEIRWGTDGKSTLGVHCYFPYWSMRGPLPPDFRKLSELIHAIADALEKEGK